MTESTLTEDTEGNGDEWEEDKLTVKKGPNREDGDLTFEGI